MITLLLNGLWVWLAVRVLGWRSTISNRTLLKFFALGANHDSDLRNLDADMTGFSLP